jgi:hypothetical protein
MKALMFYCVMGVLAMVMSSCIVTVAPGYVQEQGGYAYYYFPDYNFYYCPDINRYWWYQADGWQSGQQLPDLYVIDPNSTYIVVTSRNINPTSNNNVYRAAYQRGDYQHQLRRVNQAPPGKLPFYRPSTSTPVNRTPNNNNNGDRKAIPSQTPGSRQIQPANQSQTGTRGNDNQSSNMPQQKVVTRQQADKTPNTSPDVKGQTPASKQMGNPAENMQQRQEGVGKQKKESGKQKGAKHGTKKAEHPRATPPPVKEESQTRQQ